MAAINPINPTSPTTTINSTTSEEGEQPQTFNLDAMATIVSVSEIGQRPLHEQGLNEEIGLLGELLGAGRYGTVNIASRRGTAMAVKEYNEEGLDAWNREKMIYTQMNMRHENILNFMGTGVQDSQATQYWLVTEYHHFGSLFGYLQEHSLPTMIDLVRMIHSITCGLEYLHSHIGGIFGKPPIAHRDLKSKNILVKRDLSCCLADFDLAVIWKKGNKGDLDEDSDGDPQRHQVGTIRWMPPEVLVEKQSSMEFEFYQRGDIYSVALVFWEIYNRLVVNDQVNEYMMPYEEYIEGDPTIEEMRHLVVEQKQRPTFAAHLDGDDLPVELKIIRSIIIESWTEMPFARLTALNIKTQTLELFEHLEPEKTPPDWDREKWFSTAIMHS